MFRQAEWLLLAGCLSLAASPFLNRSTRRALLIVVGSLAALWLSGQGAYFLTLTIRARRGHSSAQLALSRWYLNQFRTLGYSDFEKCRFWLRQAADNANPEALFLLGDMHVDGFLVPFDPETGLREKARARQLGFDYSGRSLFLDRFVLPREHLIFLDKLARIALRGVAFVRF